MHVVALRPDFNLGFQVIERSADIFLPLMGDFARLCTGLKNAFIS